MSRNCPWTVNGSPVTNWRTWPENAATTVRDNGAAPNGPANRQVADESITTPGGTERCLTLCDKLNRPLPYADRRLPNAIPSGGKRSDYRTGRTSRRILRGLNNDCSAAHRVGRHAVRR